MKWAYGVTTVPARFEELLPRTLKSLSAAGFDSPRLFIDGIPHVVPEYLNGYRKTFRDKVRAFGNWVLAAWELYLHEPHAERFALFQDDFVAYKKLRDYLEQCEYPQQGYWNLYTFPQNEQRKSGWYPSNQRGLGAVALVFNNETLRTLLAQRHFVDRPLDATRGHMFVDGGIIDSLSKVGWQEYVHGPSLVQHTGLKSSIGIKIQPLSPSFLGEDFDASELTLQAPIPGRVRKMSGSNRIGLVGFNCASGLGELNRQLATYAEIDTWLVKPHRTYSSFPPHENVDTLTCDNGRPVKMDALMRASDIVVFCEQPYYPHLTQVCRSRKKRTVCIPMMEWMPAGAKGWPREVSLFICPTQDCYDQFSKTIPCAYYPWPVDLARFPFQERETCNRFLLVLGHGGFGGRKGYEVVRQALDIWPEMPLDVRSQEKHNWPEGVRVLPPPRENSELYATGDVLIAPHSVDGLGLEPMEAMVAGMPVITTDGKPWNEIPSLAKIAATIDKRNVRRPVDWYTPSAESLVEICKRWLGKSIVAESRRARAWAEERSWEKHAEAIVKLIRG